MRFQGLRKIELSPKNDAARVCCAVPSSVAVFQEWLITKVLNQLFADIGPWGSSFFRAFTPELSSLPVAFSQKFILFFPLLGKQLPL